jgi:hypothetical protein
MCGQWVWNNHNAGNLVCQQLGFQSGEMYTFGRSNYLPNLPVVYGYRTCDGSENNLFNCVAASVGGDEDWRTPADMDCRNGCLGADKIQGTDDDTIQPGECEHSVDQGAVCYAAGDSVTQVHEELKCGNGGDECHMVGVCDQGIVFGCVDYYTTHCEFDATNTAINLGANAGTYMWAMMAFAKCASVTPEPPGYCHGSLLTAGKLANHDVCEGGVTENIGFHTHLAIPTPETVSGAQEMFSIRIHYTKYFMKCESGTDPAPDNILGAKWRSQVPYSGPLHGHQSRRLRIPYSR